MLTLFKTPCSTFGDVLAEAWYLVSESSQRRTIASAWTAMSELQRRKIHDSATELLESLRTHVPAPSGELLTMRIAPFVEAILERVPVILRPVALLRLFSEWAALLPSGYLHEHIVITAPASGHRYCVVFPPPVPGPLLGRSERLVTPRRRVGDQDPLQFLHHLHLPRFDHDLALEFTSLPAFVDEEIRRTAPLRVGMHCCDGQTITPRVVGPALSGSSVHEFVPESTSPPANTLESVLAAADQQQVSILLFPELGVDLEVLASTLRARSFFQSSLKLVIAGHRHFQDDAPHNRVAILNRFGHVLWSAGKLNAYVVSPKEALLFGLPPGEWHEKHTRASSIPLCDSSIGRIATPICVDFLGQPSADLLRDAGANCFFVPASSPTLSSFREAARLYGSASAASVFVANHAAAAGASARRHAGFWYLPYPRANALLEFDGATACYVVDWTAQAIQHCPKSDDKNDKIKSTSH